MMVCQTVLGRRGHGGRFTGGAAEVGPGHEARPERTHTVEVVLGRHPLGEDDGTGALEVGMEEPVELGELGVALDREDVGVETDDGGIDERNERGAAQIRSDRRHPDAPAHGAGLSHRAEHRSGRGRDPGGIELEDDGTVRRRRAVLESGEGLLLGVEEETVRVRQARSFGGAQSGVAHRRVEVADHRRGMHRAAQVLRFGMAEGRVADGCLEDLIADGVEGEGIDDRCEAGLDPSGAHQLLKVEVLILHRLHHRLSFHVGTRVHSLPHDR
ncbi:Uncharacterised protein [Mycobacteroides abscessus subsp. abscessus]|nr:Uncharacterised protein [Mycobacteroides abscessus subsp. abscessus]